MVVLLLLLNLIQNLSVALINKKKLFILKLVMLTTGVDKVTDSSFPLIKSESVCSLLDYTV